MKNCSELGPKYESQIENWHKLTSFDLIRIGTANRKTLIEKILKSKKHLVIQFVKRSHLSMVPALKTIIDNFLGLNQKDFESKNAHQKPNLFQNSDTRRVNKTSFAKFDPSEDIVDENFNPGVLFLIHLNERSTQDLKNTGLSFWDSWDNWVIEDIVDSGYDSIEKYFYETELKADGTRKLLDELESIWLLLMNNSDLRSRVFEKLILEELMKIDEKVPNFNLEAEMSQISVLLNNNKTAYNAVPNAAKDEKFLSFIAEFSRRILEVDFIKTSLSNKDLTQVIFNKC
jgi:hypothetical protein